MKVLIIDDDPIRAIPVLEAGHDVKIAHGYTQVAFWLQCKYWVPDIICIDNDMPMMTGLEIASNLFEHLCWRKIRIWSKNDIAAPQIASLLRDRALQHFGLYEDETDITVLPFDSEKESEYWK